MGSVYRYDDSKSTISSHRGGEPNVKRVTRYIIRDQDDDTRSTYSTRSRREVEEPRRNLPEYVERDLTIRTSRKEESRSPRRDYYSREYRDDSGDREITVRRTVETTEQPKREERDLTITKFDKSHDESRHEVSSPREPYWDQDRDLQRYSRTTDYYAQQQQPQTIIIRQEPIIIRERVRDDDYQLVRKSEADEERSIARREEPRDEQYYYEKRVRERIDDDQYERKGRREVSPGDSISQVGRQRRRDRSYSSDDSMVYVRRVRDEEYGSREGSPDRKKNLAAGVIAGVGAAELLRSHRKKEGRETTSGIGRVGRDVGAGALGALAAEGIQRARSLHRERSRRRRSSRDSDWSDDRRSDRYERSRSRSRRRRSRSRSESRSRLKTLGALGLGAAAVAAAATIASKRMSKKNEEPGKERRRSRSRRRSGSVDSLESLENDPTADDARNPKHRNQRIAAAGAVGAAGAALIERARNQSAGGDRSRSRSRIRQGLPIAAAGLGTAALAGLYEKNKAKREAEKIQADQKRDAREERYERHGRSRSRGTSRGRSESGYDDYGREGPQSLGAIDPRYIEYGHGPMHGNNYGKDYYGQGPTQEPYYASQAMVPAETSRGAPRDDRRRSRSRSHDRRDRSISPGSETDRHRTRDAIGLAGAAAAVGGVAAAEHEKRKQEKRERRSRRREQDRYSGTDPHEDGYYPQNYNAPTPPVQDPYAPQFYGNTHSPLPAPPGAMPQQYPNTGIPQAYQNNAVPQTQPVTDSTTYQPPPNDTYGMQQNFQPPNNAYGAQNFPQPNPPAGQNYDTTRGSQPQSRSRGPEEEVSSGSSFPQSIPNNQNPTAPDGVNSSSDAKQQPPAINIVPPSSAESTFPTSTPNLTIPRNYNSNTDDSQNDTTNKNDVSPTRTFTELPDNHPARHVQFAPNTESSQPGPALSAQTTDTEAMSPDDRRRRRHEYETRQGYEASEDTDTSPADDPRSRAYDTRSDRDRGGPKNISRSSSNRDRNRDRAREGDREHGRDHDRDRGDHDKDRKKDGQRSSRHKSRRDGQEDDNDSDTTIELDRRFDEDGRKKPERGEDPLADRLDDIIAGKGAAGKVFGNFVDGLMGGGKGKSTDRDRDRDRKR